jgi:ribulose-5-phosphate 4-epimerase/fuculose-1-phosphate aldolase
MSIPQLLDELVAISHQLAKQGLVVLAEGNTSALDGDGFWVKASGRRLGSATAGDFVRVDLERAAAAIEGDDLDSFFATDAAGLKPSVEALMHAVCLTEGAATWVAHTHPPGILGLLASNTGAEAFQEHLYPDAIVVCGRHIAAVPYVSPGRDLAVAVRQEIRRFSEAHGHPPKTLLLGNHGMVALAASSTEALNISIMAEKWARVLHKAVAAGGPRYLSPEQADEIDVRPDEDFRRAQLLDPDH